MDLMTKQIETNQIARRVTNQFILDEDYNVPDSKSDVEKIIMSEGTVKVDEVKPVENYLRVQGCVEFRILYVAEGFEPTYGCLEGKLPFIEMVYADGGTGGNLELKNARVELNANLVHSRKVRMKAMVELELEEEKQTVEEIPMDINCECNVYKKQTPLELLRLQVSKKDMYRVKEEITLPGTKETIGRVLWTDVGNRKMDTRLAVDELQILGELLVFCFYESPEGKIDWVEQVVPYQGRVECFGIDETMYHHLQAELEGVHIDVRADEDGEMRLIGIEGTLQLSIAVYEEEKLTVMEDLYSLEKNCILETKEVEYEQLVLQNNSKCKIMERLSVPELNKEVLQICHSSGSLHVDKIERRAGGVLVEGVMHVGFLYVKENDSIPFDTWQGVVPFTHLIECGEDETEFQYNISPVLEQLSITLQGGDEVEVKAVLSFQGFFKRVGKTQMIQSVQMEPFSLSEIEKRPSIVGYVVKEGDDLWTLAKHYSTSIEAICEVNEMAEEKLRVGDRILIFKENMSIL